MPPRFGQRPNTPPFQQWGMGRQMPQQHFRPYPPSQRGPSFAGPQRGGFLARLFGGRGGFQQTPQTMNPFQFGASQPQATRSMLNPESISRFLGQTQQVLRTAQQVGPMIQQYGPLVRNLPALLKIYKGISSSNDEEEKDESDEDSQLDMNEYDDSEEIPIDDKAPSKTVMQISEEKPMRPTPQYPKKSVPKIYI